jgi:protocatechuate 3,4-dioxygenase beta subunit
MGKHGWINSWCRFWLGLVLALAGALGGQAAAALNEDTFVLEGKVLDAEGRPVAEAQVELRTFSSGLASTAELSLQQKVTTDAQGAFALRASRGVAMLIARKPGLGVTWTQLQPRLGAERDLVLAPLTTLAGVVVDEVGKPQPDAEVFVAAAFSRQELGGGRQSGGYLSGAPAREHFHARTAADGRFRIEGFPNNATAALAVKAPGKALRAAGEGILRPDSLPWQAGQQDIRLTVEPAGRVEGRIVAETASGTTPVAKLRLQPERPGLVGLGSAETAESGADGTFCVSDVAAGAYQLLASFGTNAMPDWVAEGVAVSVESGKPTSGVGIVATRGGVAEVTVLTRGERNPLAGASVNLFRANSSSAAQSDSAGLARLRLTPGEYRVFVNKDGWQSDQNRLTVEAGETNRIEVELAPLPRLGGVVRRPDGQAAAGLPVTIVGDFSRRDVRITTDAEGRFDTEWNPQRQGQSDRTYCLLIRDAERNLAVAQDVDEETGPLELRLKPGLTLSAQVECGGQPVTNVSAALIFWTGNSGMHLPDLGAAAHTPGRIEIPALPPGRRYGVIVSAPGYGPQQVQVPDTELAAGRVELDPVELKPANLKLAGQVIDAEDKPVAGAYVHLQGGEGQPVGQSRTDREGRFRFEQVCEGWAALSASAANSHGNVRAEGGDTNVVIRLGETSAVYAEGQTHKLTGVVTDPDGKTVAGARLTALPSGSGRGVKTDASGVFALTWRLEPWQAQDGSRALLVVRDADRNLAAAEDLSPDTPKIEVQLQPALALAGRVEAPDGSPLAGAGVGVWLLVARTYSQVEEKPITADAEGRFEIKTLPAGQQYVVFAQAKGRGRHQQQVNSDNQSTRIELDAFVLDLADQVIAGRVVDAKERPVAGAQVHLSGEGQPADGNATTDRQGRFSFQVCAGTMRLFAYSQGGHANASVEAGDTNIVLQLSQDGSGRRVAPRRPSLAGKPLPDLALLGLADDAVPAGQRLLLCLLDLDQRPSRRAARLLTDQHEALRQKGITIVAAQAVVTSAESFKEWQAASPVPFPVGRVSETSEKTAWATGVDSFPWLILTDTARRVVAEGFPIEELEQKLQEAAR